MFKLHAIQAEFGDSLLVEYGTASAPRFILVDGGPPDTFQNHLRSVLQQKVVPSGGQLDRVILSHVDNDHVVGLLDLFAELRAQREAGEAELVTIGGLWHNSFRRTVDVDGQLQPRLQSLLALSGVQATMDHTAISVNGIAEGNKLRQFAQILQVPLNSDLPEPITVDSVSDAVDFDNLRLTIVGPTQANLDALRQEWEEWLEQNEDEIGRGNARVMANADQSIPNLSSICVLAEADGRTLLLTGDARSDHLLKGLEARGVLDGSGRAHFDVIKAPHHGSDRNITKTFFRKVTADRYVFSANGRDGNPDLATLIWLVEAAKDQGRSPEIVLTNVTPSTRKLTEEYPPQDFGYSFRFLAENESSIEVPLA